MKDLTEVTKIIREYKYITTEQLTTLGFYPVDLTILTKTKRLVRVKRGVYTLPEYENYLSSVFNSMFGKKSTEPKGTKHYKKDMTPILEALEHKNYLSSKEIMNLGFSYANIANMVKDGRLVKISYGIYTIPEKTFIARRELVSTMQVITISQTEQSKGNNERKGKRTLDLTSIREALSKKNYLSSRELVNLGLSYNNICVMTKDGRLVKIGRGLYTLPEKEAEARSELESKAIEDNTEVPVMSSPSTKVNETTEQVPTKTEESPVEDVDKDQKKRNSFTSIREILLKKDSATSKELLELGYEYEYIHRMVKVGRLVIVGNGLYALSEAEKQKIQQKKAATSPQKTTVNIKSEKLYSQAAEKIRNHDIEAALSLLEEIYQINPRYKNVIFLLFKWKLYVFDIEASYYYFTKIPVIKNDNDFDYKSAFTILFSLTATVSDTKVSLAEKRIGSYISLGQYKKEYLAIYKALLTDNYASIIKTIKMMLDKENPLSEEYGIFMRLLKYLATYNYQYTNSHLSSPSKEEDSKSTEEDPEEKTEAAETEESERTLTDRELAEIKKQKQQLENSLNEKIQSFLSFLNNGDFANAKITLYQYDQLLQENDLNYNLNYLLKRIEVYKEMYDKAPENYQKLILLYQKVVIAIRRGNADVANAALNEYISLGGIDYLADIAKAYILIIRNHNDEALNILNPYIGQIEEPLFYEALVRIYMVRRDKKDLQKAVKYCKKYNKTNPSVNPFIYQVLVDLYGKLNNFVQASEASETLAESKTRYYDKTDNQVLRYYRV